MKRKEALYAVIGGCVGAVLTMVVCSVVPIGAQSQSDAIFGKITCREMEVVAHGRTVARINSRLGSGEMMLYSWDGNPSVQMYDIAGTGRMLLTSVDNGIGLSLSAKSMYAQKVDPVFNLGDAGWGELVLFNAKDSEMNMILPMALADTKWGACGCR